MAEAAEDNRGYRPIEAFAAIGDCHGGALVANDGGIDWCCLGRFDADPVFCRLLDAKRGGFSSVRFYGHVSTNRRYIENTNVLETEFRAASGRVLVTDFMPVGRRPDSGVHDYVHLNAPRWLVRRIDAVEGEVDLAVTVAPSVAFAAEPVRLDGGRHAVRVSGGPAIASRPLGR